MMWEDLGAVYDLIQQMILRLGVKQLWLPAEIRVPYHVSSDISDDRYHREPPLRQALLTTAALFHRSFSARPGWVLGGHPSEYDPIMPITIKRPRSARLSSAALNMSPPTLS